MSAGFCSLICCLVALTALTACNDRSSADGASSQAQIPADSSHATASAPARDTLATPKAVSSDRDSWTSGVIDVPGTGEVSTLVSLRAAQHVGYDRVVFEFAGELPGYHIEYIDRPVRSCGSGETVPLPGDAWLEVRFQPAAAHNEQGQPTIQNRDIRTALGNVLRLTTTCDFEAMVTWVVAVRSPNPVRIQRLTKPTRLAVDISTVRR